MIAQTSFGTTVDEQREKYVPMIKAGQIVLGGNSRLKIYGTLQCKQGKRLNPEGRVFFSSEEDAIASGYRPCGSCMRKEYAIWKAKTT